MDAVNILSLLRLEPTTLATLPSTTPDIDATNCATETSPKKDVQGALKLTTTNAVHVVYYFLFNGWHLYKYISSQFIYCFDFICLQGIDFKLKKKPGSIPPGNLADISYLDENFKPHLLRDVCTLCSGALVSDSLLHMLLWQTKKRGKMKVWATERRH